MAHPLQGVNSATDDAYPPKCCPNIQAGWSGNKIKVCVACYGRLIPYNVFASPGKTDWDALRLGLCGLKGPSAA